MPPRSPEEEQKKAFFWEGLLMDELAGEQETDITVIQKKIDGIVEAMKKEGEVISEKGANRLINRAESIFGDANDRAKFAEKIDKVTRGNLPKAA